MSEIHQVLVSAGPGDAITNAALQVQAKLRELGPSEIFARHVQSTLGESVAEGENTDLTQQVLMASVPG